MSISSKYIHPEVLSTEWFNGWQKSSPVLRRQINGTRVLAKFWLVKVFRVFPKRIYWIQLMTLLDCVTIQWIQKIQWKSFKENSIVPFYVVFFCEQISKLPYKRNIDHLNFHPIQIRHCNTCSWFCRVEWYQRRTWVRVGSWWVSCCGGFWMLRRIQQQRLTTRPRSWWLKNRSMCEK